MARLLLLKLDALRGRDFCPSYLYLLIGFGFYMGCGGRDWWWIRCAFDLSLVAGRGGKPRQAFAMALAVVCRYVRTLGCIPTLATSLTIGCCGLNWIWALGVARLRRILDCALTCLWLRWQLTMKSGRSHR